MRCGIYTQRPRICRIYPLESRPFTAMRPEARLCPPEAWAEAHPPLIRAGAIADPEAAAILAAHRATQIADTLAKAAACAPLGITSAASSGEGFAAHSPDPAVLVDALLLARAGECSAPTPWHITTNRPTTLALLESMECPARLVEAGEEYPNSFEAG